MDYELPIVKGFIIYKYYFNQLISWFIFKTNSGKDRTGVSVSLEQCFIMIRYHNLDNNLTQYVLDDLRR